MSDRSEEENGTNTAPVDRFIMQFCVVELMADALEWGRLYKFLESPWLPRVGDTFCIDVLADWEDVKVDAVSFNANWRTVVVTLEELDWPEDRNCEEELKNAGWLSYDEMMSA